MMATHRRAQIAWAECGQRVQPRPRTAQDMGHVSTGLDPLTVEEQFVMFSGAIPMQVAKHAFGYLQSVRPRQVRCA
jgi:hypothetical protein